MPGDSIRSDACKERIFQHQTWNICITLNNLKKELPLFPDNIIELVIHDDLISWPYRGYITINNLGEALERKGEPSEAAVTKELTATGSKVPEYDTYLFRMDGHDEIYIKISPKPDNAYQLFPEKIWTFENTYTIYDVQDMQTSNTITKRKRLYFWDKKYQILQEKNIEWSTATAKTNTNFTGSPAHVSDEKRSMHTGDALKDLLTEAGFKENISDDFDKGGTKILYSSPVQNTVNDDVDHILNSHLWSSSTPGRSSDDICIFHLDRHTKKWTLKPLHKYYDLAGKDIDEPGELQIEHLFFEGYGDDGVHDAYKAPLSKLLSLEKDIKLLQWNKIDTYQFVDMSGMDNAKALVSMPVHQYDFKNKQFIMDFENNEIERVKADFNELYIKDKLLGGSGGPSPLFTLNNLKKEQKSIQHEFNSSNINDEKSRILSGKGKILYAAVFLNERIVLRLLGSTHRLSGTFIGIDKENVYTDNDFDYKICGQWFVINVRHIIHKNMYINELTAVKVHSYEKLDIDEDVPVDVINDGGSTYG